jgi:hypothetical protein
MRRDIRVGLAIAGASFFFPGCRHAPSGPWQIVADNKSQSPCELSMDIGPGALFFTSHPLRAGDHAATAKSISDTGIASIERRDPS